MVPRSLSLRNVRLHFSLGSLIYLLFRLAGSLPFEVEDDHSNHKLLISVINQVLQSLPHLS